MAELLITLFLFITAPVSAFLLARTTLHLRGRDTGDHRP
jgi:multisubunit Na+/H+ antiporter MnhG subunit